MRSRSYVRHKLRRNASCSGESKRRPCDEASGRETRFEGGMPQRYLFKTRVVQTSMRLASKSPGETARRRMPKKRQFGRDKEAAKSSKIGRRLSSGEKNGTMVKRNNHYDVAFEEYLRGRARLTSPSTSSGGRAPRRRVAEIDGFHRDLAAVSKLAGRREGEAVPLGRRGDRGGA